MMMAMTLDSGTNSASCKGKMPVAINHGARADIRGGGGGAGFCWTIGNLTPPPTASFAAVGRSVGLLN